MNFATPETEPVFPKDVLLSEPVSTVALLGPDGSDISAVSVLSIEDGHARFLVPGCSAVFGCAASDETLAADIRAYIAAPQRPAAAPHRVLKDTIVLRVKAAGKLSEFMAMVESMPAAERFEYDQYSWFSSDNPQMRVGLQAIGLSPDSILSPDPLAH
jgi:hypothetical protein